MASSSASTIRVDGGLGSGLSPAVLRRLDGEPLLGFLRRQRWFGAKGQADAKARVRDVIPLFTEPVETVVARVEVSGASSVATYQLPLAVRTGAAEEAGVLALVESPSARGAVFDAVLDAGFRKRLLAALRGGECFETPAARWSAEPHGSSLPDLDTPSRVLGGEQSHSSIAYGEVAILKIYRRVTAGPNPEVEIAEFLAALGFPHIPALLGLIRIAEANGDETFAGIMQEFVPSLGDGWSYVRGQIRDLLIAPHVEKTGAEALLEDCRRLGEITGALHRALSSDGSNADFAPEPVGAGDLARWKEGLRSQIDTSAALLETALRSGTIAVAQATCARDVLAKAGALGDRAAAFLSAVADDAGSRIRHHGDYHLGQVLRTRDGDFVILDFEGEPARPLAERRMRHSPLRDVAGMLRSFAYAAAVSVKEAATPTRAPLDVGARASSLAAEMQRAFRDGYFRGAPASPILPASPALTDGLLTVFEIEKVFYELAYELNNRPQWADIPLGGIRMLCERAFTASAVSAR